MVCCDDTHSPDQAHCEATIFLYRSLVHVVYTYVNERILYALTDKWSYSVNSTK